MVLISPKVIIFRIFKYFLTLKRTCIITATFGVLPVADASFYISHTRLSIWCSIIVIPSCSVILIASYTKIFYPLRHHQAQEQNHVQQQPSHAAALNMARYKKAVSSALWVQLALAVCYLPKFIMLLVMTNRKTYSSHVVVINGLFNVLTPLWTRFFTAGKSEKWDKQ